MFRVEHCQSMVFGRAHVAGVGGRFVFESNQMKQAMNHDAPEFFLKHNTLIFSIFHNTLKGNEQVSGQQHAVAVVERDDVGEGVVVKVGPVVLEQFLVGAGNDADIAKTATVMGGHLFQPRFDVAPPLNGARDVSVHKNHHGLRRGRW